MSAYTGPRYWAFIDKHDGEGWQKVRRNDGKGWAYALTKYQRAAEQKHARENGWGFRSSKIDKVSSKPPKADKAQYPNATHVTRNFKWSEFACHDGTPVPSWGRDDIVRLARGLEAMRRELGDKSIGILSGYRTPAYNAAIGGASQSQHMKATAADLVVAPHGQDALVRAAERVDVFYNGGIGVYPSGAVHVDVRGYKARWTSF